MAYAHLKSATATDIGLKRAANEDAVLDLDAAGVFCIADGMGGAACGEVASRWCIEAIESAFSAGTEPGQARIECIRKAVNRASHRIRRLAIREHISGAGTTVVVLSFDPADPEQACILHAGDSRCYRLRDGDLSCLTRDHSMAAAAGVKHERNLPAVFQGVITRAVGLADTVEMDATPVAVRPGDLFLLCSDGLNRMVSDRLIHQTLKHADGDLADRAHALIEHAKSAGGHDNISVLLVEVGAAAAPAPPDETVPAMDERAPGAAAQSEPAAVPGSDAAVRSGPAAAATPESREPEAPAETVSAPEHPAPQPAQSRVRRADPTPAPAGTSWRPALVLVLLILIPVAIWSLRRASIPRIAVVYDPPTPDNTSREAGQDATSPETEATGSAAATASASASAASAHLGVPPASAPSPEAGNAPETAWRSLLRQRLDTAIQNGTWGGVADLLDTAGPAPAAWRRGVPDLAHAVIWIEVWRKAAGQPEDARRNFRGYADLASEIGRDLGAEAIPGIRAELPDAEDPAFGDAYCKALLQCRQALVDALRAAVARADREQDVLGNNPRATLEALHRFCGRIFRPETFPVSQQSRDIATLKAWLQADRQAAVPPMGIGDLPRDSMQRMTRNRALLRDGYLRAIEACPAAARHWRRAAPDRREQAARIGDLADAVLQRDRPSRDAHAPEWPDSRDRVRIRTLLASIRGFMDAEPTAD